MATKFIPDISHHDPVSSWSKAKDSCSFLISKATEGTSYTDTFLDTFIKNCEKNKIPYWLYTFLKKGNELEQTKYMVNVCKKKVGKYFVGYVLDVERNNEAKNILSSLQWLQKQGTKTMVYTQYSQMETYKSVIKVLDENGAWWEARYGKNTAIYNSKYPPHQGVDFHQFTENGRVPGISSAVDLNRICGDKSLEWFMTPLSQEKKDATTTETVEKASNSSKETVKKNYGGIYPVLPSRGYYVKGDGYLTLPNYPTQLKRVQTLLNWIDDSTKDIAVDGKFGVKTEEKLTVVQKLLKVTVNQRFDSATLKAAKAYKK